MLTLKGDRSYSATTAADGTYTVSGARAGTYSLTPVEVGRGRRHHRLRRLAGPAARGRADDAHRPRGRGRRRRSSGAINVDGRLLHPAEGGRA